MTNEKSERICSFFYSTIENVDEKTVVLKFTNGSLQVTIKEGDLSAEICDAIVNPTNVSMKPNGGLDTIIHTTMGEFFTNQVNAICSESEDDPCPVGSSRIFISKARRDPNVARFVINTVGPHYVKEGSELASFHLQSCYGTAFALANSYGLTSIAFPAISCGAFRFPVKEAVRVGIESIRQNSYQVTDVRFVLFGKPTYQAFVEEWTAYAEKINKEANVDSTQPSSPTTPQKPVLQTSRSARFCSLCKEKELSKNEEQLCGECSNLPRADVFHRYLQRLRRAAEKSLDALQDECQALESLLVHYPLKYEPAQIFDQNIHRRDHVAESYLQSHCNREFRNGMPMAVLGDGNCFYNTFVKLASAGTTTEATTITPVELRARNVIELVRKRKTYEEKYASFGLILDPFEGYVRKEMVHDTNYVGVWDLLSIPTILNVRVTSIYPKVNGDGDTLYQTINDKVFEPIENSQTTPLSEVRILFSHMNKPSKNKEKAWTPNHFVPVLSLR